MTTNAVSQPADLKVATAAADSRFWAVGSAFRVLTSTRWLTVYFAALRSFSRASAAAFRPGSLPPRMQILAVSGMYSVFLISATVALALSSASTPSVSSRLPDALFSAA